MNTSLAMPTPPSITTAPVSVEVLFVLLATVIAPFTSRSLLIVVNVPAGSSVRFPDCVIRLPPLNTKLPTPMLVGNINVLLTPSVTVSWPMFVRSICAVPKLTFPVR